ncbi:MAG: LemA family protein [bacterium]|nr:LemA family protein [bacterium]
MVPLIIVIAVIIVVFWIVGIYNSLVRQRKQVDNGWSQIDVQLKRRHDLIPNLVETVKGYAKHERELLENVTAARAHAIDTRSAGGIEQLNAETALTGALRSLMVAVEAYPDLKANQNYLALQEELTSTENKIGFARQHFNDVATNYNTAIEVFPNNFLAGMFNFQARELWQITDAVERETPVVKF